MKTTDSKILVTIEDAGNKTNNLGLTLPGDLEMQGLEKAKVLYVGGEIKCVSQGDTVIIYKGSGTKFTDTDGLEVRVINVTDIVIIYE